MAAAAELGDELAVAGDGGVVDAAAAVAGADPALGDQDVAQALPDSWRNPVTEFWPTQAGSQLTSVYHSAHTLQPWPGFGVMCLFTAIVYAIAWTLLDRRDA